MRFIVRLFAIVGLLFIVLLVGAVVGLSRLHIAGRSTVPVVSATVLTLTIAGPFAEDGAGNDFAPFVRAKGRVLRDAIDALPEARPQPEPLLEPVALAGAEYRDSLTDQRRARGATLGRLLVEPLDVVIGKVGQDPHDI